MVSPRTVSTVSAELLSPVMVLRAVQVYVPLMFVLRALARYTEVLATGVPLKNHVYWLTGYDKALQLSVALLPSTVTMGDVTFGTPGPSKT